MLDNIYKLKRITNKYKNNVTNYRIAHTPKIAHLAKTTPLSTTPYNVATT
jgi:hypothetical protein